MTDPSSRAAFEKVIADMRHWYTHGWVAPASSYLNWIEKLEAALAQQPAQESAEPVAWTWVDNDGIGGSPRTKYSDVPPGRVQNAMPLYHLPPSTAALRAKLLEAATWCRGEAAYWYLQQLNHTAGDRWIDRAAELKALVKA